MEKRDRETPYEVIIQERNRVDLYGNVVYYIYWFDKYGNDITNEWKFWSKGPKKKYDRVNRYLTDSWLKEYSKYMTFKEFMQENGYDLITTFWEDFSIADKYGIAGVKDTYKRAFSEWKDDYKFFTELTLVLNHKIWQHYKSNRELAALYDRLWREADEYAMNNFKGEELDYYYRVTD